MGGKDEREVMELPNERGYVRVFVTEANGAIPVEGALVTVTDYGAENDVLYTLRTDEGGLTETVSLIVPGAGESLNPGSSSPAGLYGITVRREGYYPVEAAAVPVFAGVLAVLPVDLVPLSEADTIGESGQIMLYETPTPFKENRGGTELLQFSVMPTADRGSGIYEDVPTACRRFVGTASVCQPKPDAHEYYGKVHKLYNKLYNQLKECYKDLASL